jgi:glyoxylase I family protein
MSMTTPLPAANTSSPFASMRGDHAAVRVPDLEEGIAWYTEKLDFRVTDRWLFGDLKLAYVAPAVDSNFKIELIGGAGAVERAPHQDLTDSLNYSGWHHICLAVDSTDATVEELRRRGVTIVKEPFELPEIGRRLAFFCDPWGNLLELTQVLA